MVIGLAILGYFLGVFLLIRFFQSVHHWDEEIETMENTSGNFERKQRHQLISAA
jgi:hypothetical protein